MMKYELTPELKNQIEQEAIDATKDRKDTDFDIGWNQGYEKGYEDAGEKYALKWQEAEQKAEKALKEIQAKAKQGIFPHLPVETMGAQMCIEIDKCITDLFTPKQTTDEQSKQRDH